MKSTISIALEGAAYTQKDEMPRNRKVKIRLQHLVPCQRNA